MFPFSSGFTPPPPPPPPAQKPERSGCPSAVRGVGTFCCCCAAPPRPPCAGAAPYCACMETMETTAATAAALTIRTDLIAGTPSLAHLAGPKGPALHYRCPSNLLFHFSTSLLFHFARARR